MLWDISISTKNNYKELHQLNKNIYFFFTHVANHFHKTVIDKLFLFVLEKLIS